MLEELKSGGITQATRFKLSVAAFNRISNYDAAISDYLSALTYEGEGTPTRSEYPAQSNARFVKLQDLRYGENPHQQAAFYVASDAQGASVGSASQLQGKELSFNNLADADTALRSEGSCRNKRCAGTMAAFADCSITPLSMDTGAIER